MIKDERRLIANAHVVNAVLHDVHGPEREHVLACMLGANIGRETNDNARAVDLDRVFKLIECIATRTAGLRHEAA